MLFNILDAIEDTFFKDNKYSTKEKVLNIVSSPVRPIYTLILTSWTTYRLEFVQGFDFSLALQPLTKLKIGTVLQKKALTQP